MSAQPSLFAPSPADDAAWLARVRADAARWWRTYDAALGCPLTVDGTYGWVVRFDDLPVAGPWPDEATARVWLVVALGAANWATARSLLAVRAAHGEELDMLAARLRRAVTGSELR